MENNARQRYVCDVSLGPPIMFDQPAVARFAGGLSGLLELLDPGPDQIVHRGSLI
jgi:hypothetical protein